MGTMTATQMQTELAARIPGISTGPSSRAEAAILRANRWIDRQGSFIWQLTAVAPTSIVFAGNSHQAPSDFDGGKSFLLTNPDGTPVRRVGPQDGWMGDNYNTITDSGFDICWLAEDEAIAPQSW